MKQFRCTKCRCMRFWRVSTSEHIVDWSQEGAVEGHPRIEGAGQTLLHPLFRCAECGHYVSDATAIEMDKEVL